MNEFMAIENCQFELDMMTSEFNYNNKMRMLDLQLMESTITDDVYVEGVVETISKFFDDLIEKIKEMFAEAKKKIREKMLEAKFQKMCKDLKKAYAKDKSAFSGKKIKFFDYKKYYKEATKHIHDMHTVIMEMKKKDFKSVDELSRWENSIYKSHNWDITTDIEKYYFDVLISEVINQVDGYAESVLETAAKIENEMIKVEEEVKSLAAEEAAKEKTDSDNVSKLHIFKKVGNNICQFGKKVASYMPYVGYKTLALFYGLIGVSARMSAVDKVFDGKFVDAAVDGLTAVGSTDASYKFNTLANSSKEKAKEKNKKN